MTAIVVPKLGEAVSTGIVSKWLKKAGETVAADEPVVEIETDKVTIEVNAPAAGVLEMINAVEGSEVAVGTVLGSILVRESTPSDAEGLPASKVPGSPNSNGQRHPSPPAPEEEVRAVLEKLFEQVREANSNTKRQVDVEQMSPPNGSSDPSERGATASRVSFTLGPQAEEAVRNIAQAQGKPMHEVMRQAIGLLQYLHEVRDAGSTVLVRDKKGQYREVVL